MAFPLPRGITPAEIAFLCEMEMVTILPRQRLTGLELLGGPTEPLQPPRRTRLPLWLAILLKRQRRANILPPSWLHPEALTMILDIESNREEFRDAFSPPAALVADRAQDGYGTNFNYRSGGARRNAPLRTLDGQKYFPAPPFLPQNVADETNSLARSEQLGSTPALPYHWLEIGTMLLDHASDDLVDPDQIRRLLRDLREVRMAKMRKGVDVLDAAAMGGGTGVKLTGVGAMEVGEGRGFVQGVVEGLRKIGASKEQARREREVEERANGGYGAQDYDDEDDDMQL